MFARIQTGKEKDDRSLDKSKQIEKVQDVSSIEHSKRSLRMEERPLHTETAYYGQRMTNGHQLYYYQEELDGEKSVPIHRKKSDSYKGGAELEYQPESAALMFNFEDSEKWTPDLLREGIKGVSFDHTVGTGNVIRLQGDDWNLTVELMGFNSTSIESNQKTAITLELIVGGPTGTKLSKLPKAAAEAASEIGKMDEHAGTELTFTFNEQIFQVVADNIIRHYQSHAQRKMNVIKEKYPKYYYEYQCDQYILSYDHVGDDDLCRARILIAPRPKADETGENTSPPSLHQIPPPPPSRQVSPPRLLSRSMSQTVPGGPPASKRNDDERDNRENLEKVCGMLRLVDDDLERKKRAEGLKKRSRFSMEAKVKLPIGALSGVNWGLQVTLGIPVTEIPGMIGKLLESTGTMRAFSDPESFNTVSEEELREYLLQEPNYQGTYDHYLKGLAEIISAYRRGIGCAANAGPKHGMRLVNKNPLDQVILNMEGGTPEEKQTILETCVDMISKGNDGNSWNWEGASLSIEEWKQRMKGNPPVDLVSVYDGAYRHGQIGQLSELNEADGSRVPVFEFRELSSIKLNQLESLFQQVVEYCDQEELPQYDDA